MENGPFEDVKWGLSIAMLAYRRASYLLTLTVMCVGGLIRCFVRINTHVTMCVLGGGSTQVSIKQLQLYKYMYIYIYICCI